jgi:hypothetical protein
MPEPVTIGVLVASALAMAGEAALKGVVGEAAKGAYNVLRDKVSLWARGDVEALEKAPVSQASQALIAEVVDGQSAEDRTAVRALAEQLIAALKDGGKVGLDIGRLQALEVQLGAITVTEGTGARIDEARVLGTFKTGDISVGPTRGKA